MASSWLERTGDEEEAREQICLNSAQGVLFPVYAARFGKRLVRRWQKGLTTASSLVQSLSRHVRNKARNAEANGEEERKDRCVKRAVCSSFSLTTP